jgi:hypothetical protein
MDNASFHHGGRIQELFDQFGVILENQSSYSPNLNLIKEFSGDLRTWLKRH